MGCFVRRKNYLCTDFTIYLTALHWLCLLPTTTTTAVAAGDAVGRRLGAPEEAEQQLEPDIESKVEDEPEQASGRLPASTRLRA